MSKFGVLVMGPAGAGKVCERFPVPHEYRILTHQVSDDLLFRPCPAFEAQQALLLLRES
jgi:hypothetical protein